MITMNFNWDDGWTANFGSKDETGMEIINLFKMVGTKMSMPTTQG